MRGDLCDLYALENKMDIWDKSKIVIFLLFVYTWLHKYEDV